MTIVCVRLAASVADVSAVEQARQRLEVMILLKQRRNIFNFVFAKRMNEFEFQLNEQVLCVKFVKKSLNVLINIKAAASALDELLRRVAEERRAEEKRRGSKYRRFFVFCLRIDRICALLEVTLESSEVGDWLEDWGLAQ